MKFRFDPQKHHRRSIRLKGYDYRSAGAYFVTIVTYQRECVFGEIVNGEMRLNDYGKIADEHWQDIPNHFPNVDLGTYVIMPNHVHGIIVVNDQVGATQCVAPTPPRGPQRRSIWAIVGSYKSSVSYRINKQFNVTNIWQRNYHEHIIRDDDEHNRIHLYIESNPANWMNDEENSFRNTLST
jgi:REP element-mobilizing transposase RayT